MNSLQHFFHNAWRRHCGMEEIEEYIDKNKFCTVPDIEEIKKLSFNEDFVKLMNNRMVMGFFRYGNRHAKKSPMNNIKSAERRIELYKQSGNLEFLLDAANMLRMEFEIPQHPHASFNPQDDGEHFN